MVIPEVLVGSGLLLMLLMLLRAGLWRPVVRLLRWARSVEGSRGMWEKTKNLASLLVSKVYTNVTGMIPWSAAFIGGIIHTATYTALPGAGLLQAASVPLGFGAVTLYLAVIGELSSRRRRSMGRWAPLDLNSYAAFISIGWVSTALVNLALHHPAVFTDKVNLLVGFITTSMTLLGAAVMSRLKSDAQGENEVAE